MIAIQRNRNWVNWVCFEFQKYLIFVWDFFDFKLNVILVWLYKLDVGFCEHFELVLYSNTQIATICCIRIVQNILFFFPSFFPPIFFYMLFMSKFLIDIDLFMFLLGNYLKF